MHDQLGINGVKIWLVSVEDLILSKLVWAKDSGSEMQMGDVRNLMKGADIDSVYLARWAKVLSVDDQLSQLER